MSRSETAREEEERKEKKRKYMKNSKNWRAATNYPELWDAANQQNLVSGYRRKRRRGKISLRELEEIRRKQKQEMNPVDWLVENRHHPPQEVGG